MYSCIILVIDSTT